MQAKIAPQGKKIHILHREFIDVLEILNEHFSIIHLFSHQETGNKLTFERDKAVSRFCKLNHIIWEEYCQDGVIRGLKTRKNWPTQLESFFSQEIVSPDIGHLNLFHLPVPIENKLKGNPLPRNLKTVHPAFQIGGQSYAQRYFKTFLDKRVAKYGKNLSKPGGSRFSCSRLSPYLAYGNISSRESWQATIRATTAVKKWSLDNFRTRLWWRSHYIQKLESMWRMEFQPINPGMKQLKRQNSENLFHAWSNGNTGFPMVDASMRCLQRTGWINFRMRAMLVTFATFTLWLDWRLIATHLAKLFLDFEPGIHYPQIQMQAGLTGYHTLRIFNPTVQSKQHDPEGNFVREWIPALEKVPTPQIYEPWKMSSMEQSFFQCKIGDDYPFPIVDYRTATQQHKRDYWQIRNSKQVKNALPGIWQRLCLQENIESYKSQI